MSAPIIALADEVVGILNPFLAGQSIIANRAIATREYNPQVNLKNLKSLRVVVYPARNLSETDLTRSMRQYEYTLEILFQEKLGPPGKSSWTARIDQLVELVDKAADLFRLGQRLPVTTCYQTECAIEPVFSAEHLDQRNTFSSVLTVTFTQERS